MRTYPSLSLSNSPLILVLCQVRIATVRNMESYIPGIQDMLRRNGFPIDVSGEERGFIVQPGGPAQEMRRPHWEFWNITEDWSIIVRDSAIIVQTKAYTGFDGFVENLSLAIKAVDTHAGDLVLERIGLRYVDAIRPKTGEDWKNYVKEEYHGIKEMPDIDLYRSELLMQTMADTIENGDEGRVRQRIIVRLAQNREGMLLPPDMAGGLFTLSAQSRAGELLTLLDLDHYREERKRLKIDDLIGVAWNLHDGIDILFRNIVTKHALKTWGQKS